MSRALDPAVAAKLVKILGRLGSDHDGERAAAALLAHRMVRGAGLDWDDILGVTDADEPLPPTDHREKARWTIVRLHRLNAKEADFLASMAEQAAAPTERQVAWLDALARRAAAEGGR
jgi:hypothetical protein